MQAATAQGGTAANGQAAFVASTAMTVRLLTGTVPPAEAISAALASEIGVAEERSAVVGD
jgi:shikimate 5-dehydrogenase